MSGIYQKPIERYVAGIFFGVMGVLSGPRTFAQPGPSFQGLGTVAAPDFIGGTAATDISADGLVVVGTASRTQAFTEPFRWTQASGFLILDGVEGAVYSAARATSGDGSVVVGTSNVHDGRRAFRWTFSEGTVCLGDLPGGDVDSEAFAVSADGSVIVGYSESALGQEAFRWTPTGGMVGLGFLPGLTFASNASDVSGDGSVIVGSSAAEIGSDPAGEAFRWTADEGMVGLGDLPGGSFQSHASAVSADGSVVVGSGNNSESGREAFRWTAAEGMVGLGDLPGGSFNSMPIDVSADGTVIVGWGKTATDQEAFIWDAVNGMRNLKSVLENELGLDLTGWHLRSGNGVSDDGRVITGTGRKINERSQAWIAVLSECGTDADCSDALFCNGAELCVNNVCTPGPDPCLADQTCDEERDRCIGPIPTVSQWGLIILALLLLTAGSLYSARRRSTDTSA